MNYVEKDSQMCRTKETKFKSDDNYRIEKYFVFSYGHLRQKRNFLN
jgi:hypothetical protein